MEEKLSKEVIKWLETIKNETCERKFVFALEEELEKIGLEDEEVNRLVCLYWELDDLLYNLDKKYFKKG